MSSSSAEMFTLLYNFLKSSSLDKITTSNIITQQQNCFKIQSENEDFDCLIEILKSVENEVNDEDRKQHLKSLQNINQVIYIIFVLLHTRNNMMNMLSRQNKCSAIEKATYCQQESLLLYL